MLAGSQTAMTTVRGNAQANYLFPQEILDKICEQVYLDPAVGQLGSTATLKTLSLTSRGLYTTASRLLFHNLSITLDRHDPKTFGKNNWGSLLYLGELVRSNVRFQVRELVITCGCVAHLASTGKPKGWERMKIPTITALVQFLSNVAAGLPQLTIVEAGFCRCHEMSKSETDSVYEPQAACFQYGRMFEICQAVLGRFAGHGRTSHIHKCRIRSTEWQDFEPQFGLADSVAPGDIDGWDIANTFRRLVTTVSSLQLREVPGDISSSQSCVNRTALAHAAHRIFTPGQELQILSSDQWHMPAWDVFVPSRLEKLTLQGQPKFDFFRGQEFSHLLDSAKETLREIHLESIVVSLDDDDEGWSYVFDSLRRVDNLQQCTLLQLGYGVNSQDYPVQSHEVNSGPFASAALSVAIQGRLDVWTPLVSANMEDWGAFRKLIIERPKVIKTCGNVAAFLDWINTRSASDMAKDMKTSLVEALNGGYWESVVQYHRY